MNVYKYECEAIVQLIVQLHNKWMYKVWMYRKYKYKYKYKV